MARKSARNVNPSLSDDPRDKMLAALNWPIGMSRREPDFARAPIYYAACKEWFDRLSLDHVELVGTVQTIYNTPRYGGEKSAVDYAQDLPPAPRCPL